MDKYYVLYGLTTNKYFTAEESLANKWSKAWMFGSKTEVIEYLNNNKLELTTSTLERFWTIKEFYII